MNAEPGTPGYLHLGGIEVIHPEMKAIDTYSCRRCGAVVTSTLLHDQWHNLEAR